MNIGISVYLGTPFEENEKIIKKAREAGVSYAFTSLQIPEERITDYEMTARTLIKKCRDSGIRLITDVSPETMKKLSCDTLEELADWGITALRLDYGSSPEEIVKLSEKFMLVLNASTITEGDIEGWRRAGAEFSRFIACHNYYPKPYTGLSADYVGNMNARLKALGFRTMAFIPGDKVLRGPLFEGLPTIEEHRFDRSNIMLHILQLYYDMSCDMAAVGDVDISDEAWADIGSLNRNVIPLKASVAPGYKYVIDCVHHDRIDSSSYLFRSVESRKYKTAVAPENCKERKAGSICLSNSGYLRYEGELEITRLDMESDERVNVIGHIDPSCLKYLPYIRQGMGILLTE